MTAPASDLIFDLGLHRGHDTDYYLRKGFRVVAVEARPDFCAEVAGRFAGDIAAGRLTVVPRAFWERGGATIPFWVNPEKDDWSSVRWDFAAKGGHAVEEIRVETITLAELFDAHGVPHYLKCDIEGLDEECARQLLADPRRPAFVSFEASSFDILALLRAAGYDRAQLVNQALIHMDWPPLPAREGRFAKVEFHGLMSGLFGRELDSARWLDFAEIAERYADFINLSKRDPRLGYGWLDVHATTAARLAEG